MQEISFKFVNAAKMYQFEAKDSEKKTISKKPIIFR